MHIRRMTVEDWRRVRSIRLRALADAPDAFATTFAEAEAHTETTWRQRLANEDAATFVASDGGADIGLVTGAPFEGRERAGGLFSMWVAPEARGNGIADELVRAVVEWARADGYQRLILDVADDNVAAIRLYERMGFRRTGKTGSLPPPRSHIREHERELFLGDGSHDG